jgi:hypothetical protein
MLRKKISESVFDPRAKGPMKPIVDMNDPKFIRQQVIMLLHEAEWSKNSDEKMKQAISLLALARCFASTPASAAKRKVNPQTIKRSKVDPEKDFELKINEAAKEIIEDANS